MPVAVADPQSGLAADSRLRGQRKDFGRHCSGLFYNYSHPIIMRLTHEQFRELAAKHGLAVTHQRQVVYEAVIASHGHYSPEDIYATVRRRIPSISLATVYNNLRLFIECGMLREVSPPPATLLVDGTRK